MKRARLAALAAAALCAALPAAAHAQSWSPTPFPPGGNAGTSKIETAFDGEGDGVAAWVRDTAVVVSERAAGGSWSEPRTVVPGGDVFDPVVAVHPDGTAVVAWTRNTTTIPTRTVVEALYRPAGGSFGDPVTLSDPSVNSDTPTVAFAPDGTAYVAYGTEFLSSRNARVSSRSPGADGWSHETVGGSSTIDPVGDVGIGVGTGGRIIVSWVEGYLPQDDNDPGMHVKVTQRTAGGAWPDSAVTLDSQLRCDPDPRIAYRADAGVVVWRNSDCNSTGDLRSSVVSSLGYAAPFVVPGSAADQLENVGLPGQFKLAADAAGNATLAWIADGDVKVARNPAGGGSSFEEPVPVDAQEGFVYGGNGGDPAFDLAVGTNGRAAVSFIRTDDDGVRVRVGRRSEGGSWAVDTVVPPVESKNHQDTDVAFDDDDNILLASIGQGDSDQYVPRFDVFDVTPPALGTVSIPSTGTTGVALPFSASATEDWTTPELRWSADGSLIGTGSPLSHAFASAGVKSVSVVARSAGGDSAAATGSVTISGPPTVKEGADTQQPVVPGPPPVDPQPGPPGPAPVQPQPPAPPTAQELAGELTSSVVEELGGSLKTVTSGFTVEARAPGAGRLASCVFLGKGNAAQCLSGTANRRAVASAAAKRKGKAAPRNLLARGTRTFTAAGTAKIRLKPAKAAKARLKGRKKAKVTVMTVFRPAGGGAPVVTTTAVTLKR